MKNKIKNWIKENWWLALGVSIICIIVYWGINSLWLPETKQSLERPLTQLKFEDLVILVILHAWLNKSEDRCNCKNDKK